MTGELNPRLRVEVIEDPVVSGDYELVQVRIVEAPAEEVMVKIEGTIVGDLRVYARRLATLAWLEAL